MNSLKESIGEKNSVKESQGKGILLGKIRGNEFIKDSNGKDFSQGNGIVRESQSKGICLGKSGKIPKIIKKVSYMLYIC